MSECICVFDYGDGCGGLGEIHCQGCGGDFCACRACFGCGSVECPGCDYCENFDEED